MQKEAGNHLPFRAVFGLSGDQSDPVMLRTTETAVQD